MRANYEKEPPGSEQKSLSVGDREKNARTAAVNSGFNFVSDFGQVQRQQKISNKI